MKPSQDQRIYEFGKFRLDPTRRLVEREGAVLPLTPKMVETLLALVERAGEVVDKDTLMERVWPGTLVCFSAIDQRLAQGTTQSVDGLTSDPARVKLDFSLALVILVLNQHQNRNPKDAGTEG